MPNIPSTPRQQVVIYPFVERFVKSTDGQKILKTSKIEITDSVLDFTYTKTKANVSGSFTITLAPTKKWNDIIKAGDWLTIHHSQVNLNPKTTQGLLCIGSVDRCYRTFAMDEDGKTTVRFKVDGRDFGKVFEETKFYCNPYLAGSAKTEAEIATVTSTNATTVLGHPAKLLLQYYNLYFGDGLLPVRVPGFEQTLNQVNVPPELMKIFGLKLTNTISDIVRIKIGTEIFPLSTVQDVINAQFTCRFDGKLDTMSLFPEGFSYDMPLDLINNNNIWDVLKSIANLSMNELYTSMEYYPLEDRVIPTIVFRKIPFRKGIYTKLDKVLVSTSRIVNEDLGFSDFGMFNYVQLDSTSNVHESFQAISSAKGIATRPDVFLSPSGEEITGVPYMDVASIKRYGYRPISPQSSFIWAPISSLGDKKAIPYKDLYVSWFRELVEIWTNSHRFEEGTLILKGFSRTETLGKLKVNTDSISVGQNAWIPEQSKMFHIEGFSKTWTAPGTLSIVMTVTKGVYYDGRGDFKFLDEIRPDSYVEKVSHNIVKARKR